MPHMLGWFSMQTDYRPEEIEWIQARSAAFNAGYLLRIDDNIDKNGFKDELFSLISEWQKARRANAFTDAQKIKLQDPKNEFHLEKINDNTWNLAPVNFMRGYVHKFRLTQTGEPGHTEFNMQNQFDAQPLEF